MTKTQKEPTLAESIDAINNHMATMTPAQQKRYANTLLKI